MNDNERAFQAMVLKGIELEQPKRHADDLLTHDRLALGLVRCPEARVPWEAPDGAPFVWIVRDCGTELIRLPETFEEEGEIISLATLRYYEAGNLSHDNVRVFLWDGLGPGLVETSLKQARLKLFEAFYHYQWRNRGLKAIPLAS